MCISDIVTAEATTLNIDNIVPCEVSGKQCQTFNGTLKYCIKRGIYI